MDDYFESETTYDDEQRVEPGDERSAAIATARSWELPYLDDEPILIDGESAARVGGEELARIGAVTSPASAERELARLMDELNRARSHSVTIPERVREKAISVALD